MFVLGPGGKWYQRGPSDDAGGQRRFANGTQVFHKTVPSFWLVMLAQCSNPYYWSPETGKSRSWPQTSISVCTGRIKISFKIQQLQGLFVDNICFCSQCPHEMMCPKLAQEPVTPCNFHQRYHPLPLPGVKLLICKSAKQEIRSNCSFFSLKINFYDESKYFYVEREGLSQQIKESHGKLKWGQ